MITKGQGNKENKRLKTVRYQKERESGKGGAKWDRKDLVGKSLTCLPEP